MFKRCLFQNVPVKVPLSKSTVFNYKSACKNVPFSCERWIPQNVSILFTLSPVYSRCGTFDTKPCIHACGAQNNLWNCDCSIPWKQTTADFIKVSKQAITIPISENQIRSGRVRTFLQNIFTAEMGISHDMQLPYMLLFYFKRL